MSEFLIYTLSGHNDYVNGCAVSPDGAWIASTGGGIFDLNTVKIWDIVTRCERLTLYGHKCDVMSWCRRPDGTWIVSASLDKTLKIWDVATGLERLTLTGHDGYVL